MAVKIRLKRMGRRKRPFYRVVAIDSKTRRDGKEIERLGWFDPLKTDVGVDLKEDRILYWLQQGAQPSETVDNIFGSIGLKYKMHLIKEGRSDDEIAELITEWRLKQEESKIKKEEKKNLKKKAASTSVAAADEPKEEMAESGEDKAEASTDEPKEDVAESGEDKAEASTDEPKEND